MLLGLTYSASVSLPSAPPALWAVSSQIEANIKQSWFFFTVQTVDFSKIDRLEGKNEFPDGRFSAPDGRFLEEIIII